ncbi:uncharacterized protein BX664DRAFT_353148 [Halteromyces radiatus]|uniref:uncharacterized protein n=1 Tax=Halteromyces radiatus TaxID=101107 RepID=UPI00222015C9|nr:uncharacterized protein BX664DRAFT_353148 [Halteromyces radiatus]KAI8080005.1 hypothetical protein BX664DRAFT_353148 [Halteromyces radiatus]
MNIVKLMQMASVQQQCLNIPLSQVENLELEFIKVFPQFLDLHSKNQDNKQTLEMVLYNHVMPVALELIHAKFEKPTTKTKAQAYIEARSRYLKERMKNLRWIT